MSNDNDTLLRQTRDAVIENTTTLSNFIKSQEKLNQYYHDKHRAHDVSIHGDDNSIGIKGRVDRVEQRNKITNWVSMVALAAWIGNGVKHFWPFGGGS